MNKKEAAKLFSGFRCPMPIMNHDTVQLAHGSGGKLSAELVEKLFLPRFTNKTLDKLEDQALLDVPGGQIAFSTDTFVVDPLFFPGGNIGDLAINGTVNDVCMCGAKPFALSVGFIIEEGLELEVLHQILLTMEKAASDAGVQIVTGDTKVVPKGSCDKIFINTSGIGLVPEGVALSAKNIAPGDKIILSGTLADHGMAVMTCREGLSFQSEIESDTAPLNGLVSEMLKVGTPKAMRDPTRGGLATTLNEFANSSNNGIVIQRSSLVIQQKVQGACEILGIDPLTVANEGKLVAVVPPGIADEMVSAMREHPQGKNAVIIGEVTVDHPGTVAVQTGFGVKQVLEMPIGEQLPRIC